MTPWPADGRPRLYRKHCVRSEVMGVSFWSVSLRTGSDDVFDHRVCVAGFEMGGPVENQRGCFLKAPVENPFRLM